MTSLVTGAAGFIGGNLVRALLQQGRTVRALVHHDRRALEGLDIEIVEGSIMDPGSLARAFQGAETVFHTAGYVSIRMDDWPRLEEINVRGTHNVVKACLDSGVRRLVHFSSIEALDPYPPDQPISESRAWITSDIHSAYGLSKAASDRMALEGMRQGLSTVILYPTGMIGANDFGPSYGGKALLLLARGRLPVCIQGGTNWADVQDVARAAVQAERFAPSGSHYILSGNWVSVREMAEEVERITGVKTPLLTLPVWLLRFFVPLSNAYFDLIERAPLFTHASLNALSSYRLISHERASRELDYRPRPFRETVRNTLQWFSKQGYLAWQPQAEDRTAADWVNRANP